MMDLNTEIRKLNSKDLLNLVQILEIDESWRKLMATIPKTLFLDDYECKITIHNRHKYNSDHFKIIENAGSKYKKLCSEILLDEWGTSGRIRPRLGHLVSLLKKAELYRAADYVAINLLQLPEVERPSTGPAAKVPIPKDEDLQKLIHTNYPSSLLNGDPLPSSVLNRLRTPSPIYPSSLVDGQISSAVLNQIAPNRHTIPKIIVNKEENVIENSEISIVSVENNSIVPAFSDLLKSQENLSKEVNISQENTSNSPSDTNSAIYVTNSSSNLNSNIPNLTFLNNQIDKFSLNDTSNELNQNKNLPNISILNPENNFSDNIPAFSQIILSEKNSDTFGGYDLPNLTLLNQNLDSNNIPALSQILKSSENFEMPAFSQIFTNKTSDLNENPTFSKVFEAKNQVCITNHKLNDGTQKSQDIIPNLTIFQNKSLDQNSNLDECPNLSIFQKTNSESPAFNQILTNTSDLGPAFSQTLNPESQIQGFNTPKSGAESESHQNLPNLSNFENITSNFNNPAFSQIMTNTGSDLGQGPAFSQILNIEPQIQGSNIPNSGAESENYEKLSDLENFKNITSDFDKPAFKQVLQSTPSEMEPHLSGLLKSDLKPNLNESLSLLLETEVKIPELRVSSETSEGSDTFVPAFSQILDAGFSNLKIEITKSNSNTSSGSASPNFNVLKSNSSCELRDFGNLKGSKTSLKSENFGSNLTVQSSPSRSCGSPLPNLSLNTILPHFTYQELEKCTNNFDETVVSDQDSQNLNQAARIGRKLGSGAFGTVYLGIGLLERAVAVKKLNLNGVNVVNVNDTITKQFRNEVELLCKYKHENLLSLLGYSCDGPTYCLVYEYICGGALKDRLEYSLKWPDKFRLLWTDRLYIALGTAKAVSYLHNAYSMPLIHRDIKSANILLDGFNKPKLCDFGLIKLTPNPNTNTSTSVFGTSAYMAPEAFRGDVSVKLDTFSFGVVLLELLTSLAPLDASREGNDLVTHIEDLCENDIKPILDMNAGSWVVDNTNFGDELFDVAMECLEEKRHRPVMSVVVTKLSELIKKSVP